MSLNDGIDEDLRKEADYLTTEDTEVEKEDLTVVTDKKIDATLPEDVDATVDALDHYDVKIRTMENDVEKLHDLRDVANTVMSQETISQEDTVRIQEEYPDLYTDVADIKEYTEEPTSVNLQETQRYVQDKVDQKFEEVKASVLHSVKTNIDNFETVTKELVEDTIPSLLRELATMREEANDVIEDTIDIKKYLVYHKGFREEDDPQVYNLTTIPLEVCDWREKYLISEDFEFVLSEDLLEKFNKVSTSEKMQYLIKKACSLSDTLAPPAVMSVKDILNLYVTGVFERYLTATLEDHERNLQENLVEKIRSSLEAEHTDATLEELVKNTRKLYTDVDHLRSSCYCLRAYISVTHEIIEALDD